MIYVLSSAESRAFDRYLIDEVGMSPFVLMENAARTVVEESLSLITEKKHPTVYIFCGKGNNGGDGLAAARLFSERECNVHVFLVSRPSELSVDASIQFAYVKKCIHREHVHTYPIKDTHFISHDPPDLIIDALVGTGFSGTLKGKYLDAVRDMMFLAEHFDASIVSVDVPSGLDADTGKTAVRSDDEPMAVAADMTVTMAAVKRGLLLADAPDLVGDLRTAPLGYPIDSWRQEQRIHDRLIGEDELRSLLTKRSAKSSKFDYGHVLSICGSEGMYGAGILSARAALRTGAGLVTLATNAEAAAITAPHPEIMVRQIQEYSSKTLTKVIEKATVIVAGSGLPNNESIAAFAKELLAIDKPLILDAGAVGALVSLMPLLKKRRSLTVLTPHYGEFAMMLGIEREAVEYNVYKLIKEFAGRLNAVIVLKGPVTLIADSKNVYYSSAINPGMATAGTGDVLGGIIGGCIAQFGARIESVLGAVYLHSEAGRLASEVHSEQAMTSGDIIDQIGSVFKSIQ